ncbi:MAG TPA: HEAT repeat domain-containing protein [Polyangia bacterium]|nr:HEAT repeat domain-containing protein [Polyangia bacterium]
MVLRGGGLAVLTVVLAAVIAHGAPAAAKATAPAAETPKALPSLPRDVREDCWLRAQPGEQEIPCALALEPDSEGLTTRAMLVRSRVGGRRGIAILTSTPTVEIIGAGRPSGALGTDLGWMSGWAVLHPHERSSIDHDALWLTATSARHARVGAGVLLAPAGEEAENVELYGPRDHFHDGAYAVLAVGDLARRFVGLDLLKRYDVAPVKRPLLAALDDPDELVRLAVAEALAASKVTEAADAVAAWLAPGRTDVSPFTRRQIALSLGGLGTRTEHGDHEAAGSVITALASALDDPAQEVRKAAVWALGEIGGPESSRLIAGRAHDPDRRVRRSVALALGNAGGPAAVDALRALFSDSDGRARLLAVTSADKLELRALIPAFIERLHDTDGEVQYAAVGAVDKLRVREAAPHLVPLLTARGPRQSRPHALCFQPGIWLNLDCAAARALEHLGDAAGLAEAKKRVPHCLAKP